MKEKIIENGIEYVRDGDYYIPNLKAPEGNTTSVSTAGYSQYSLKKTDLAYTQRKCSTGLGLPILKRLIQLQKKWLISLLKIWQANKGLPKNSKQQTKWHGLVL